MLAKIDVLSHGQFGNWCIQHICEHGAPHDRSRAIEHILLRAVDYSMDQFASKIVEKCLKIGGSEFLDRYLSRVCTGRADRPRMPLIDSKLNVPFSNLYFLHSSFLLSLFHYHPTTARCSLSYSCRRSIWKLSDSMDFDECCSSPT